MNPAVTTNASASTRRRMRTPLVGCSTRRRGALARQWRGSEEGFVQLQRLAGAAPPP